MAADGDDHVGRTFGNYRLVREIGHGGMGIVYEAVHDAIGRRAAIKVLRAHLANDPDVIERFFREARAVNQVRHPSLVQIFDMGRTDDGVVYSVMEFLEGESLASRLRRQGPMAPIDAMRCFGECADALAAVHAHGIAHRDLKPDNIFLAREPGDEHEHAVLLDFGVAKLMDQGPGLRGTLSGNGAIVGTPMYMSPEQVEGRQDVDTRADVYSMGCVLYDMLTGAPPFLASSIAELLLMHRRQTPPLLRSRRPELPPAMDDAVQIAMAKDPGQRFDTIVAFTAALRSAAGPFGVAMPLVRKRAPTSPGDAVGVVAGAPLRPTANANPNATGNGSRARRRPAMTTGAGAAAEMVAREASETRLPTSRPGGGARTTRWLVAGAAIAAVAIATPLAWHFIDGGGGGKNRFASPGLPDAGSIILREEHPEAIDAGSANGADVAPATPASEAACRAALAHAAPLFAKAVPDAARAWRRLADPTRTNALVAACTAQFDVAAAACFQAATDALAVARCGDALVQRRCDRGLAEACGDASQIDLAAGRYDAAVRQGEASCRAGIGHGCATLGNAWTYGRGTAVDLQQARAAFERGAAVDDPESQAGLARLLRYGLGGGFDATRARQLYGTACAADASHWACAGLAEMELAGLGGRQTRSAARAHLEPACRADVPEACMRLAGLSHGADKERLYASSRSVFALEAERKPLAALRLGELTRDGHGGRADAAAARVLFVRACDAHEPLACEALADLMISGSIGDPDLAGARPVYERSCRSGLARSCEAFHCLERLDPAANVPAETPGLADCKRLGYLGPVRREGERIHQPPVMRQPDNDSGLSE